MPINVFGNSTSSYDKGKKTDTSIFVRKPCLGTNYKETKIEEDIDRTKINTELKLCQILYQLEKLVVGTMLIKI